MNLRTYLICRIIFTSLFLIMSTIIWFNKNNSLYHNLDNNIKFNEIVLSDLPVINSKENNIYKLKIENKENVKKDIKIYIVKDLLNECVSNNYIKYQINDDSIKTLNMDGMIMVDSIDARDIKSINLKIWLSDTYQGELNYSGRIIVG